MGKQSRRKRRDLGRVPADIREAIDTMVCHDPDRRRVVLEVAAEVVGDAYMSFHRQASPHQRAASLLGMRDALQFIADGRKCDVCQQHASRHVRFIATPYNGQSLVGFATLCDACDRLKTTTLEKRIRDRAIAEMPEENFYRPAAIGARVGGVSNLPAGVTLQTCTQCQSPVWIHPGDTGDEGRERVEWLCQSCALDLTEKGQLHCVLPSPAWKP
jgi:hypothetical protein